MRRENIHSGGLHYDPDLPLLANLVAGALWERSPKCKHQGLAKACRDHDTRRYNMNTRWAPAKSLQMAFSFSPLVLSLLLSLFAASSISAFSTVTTTRLSSSNSVDSKEEENGSYSWQQFQLRRRRHQKDNCNASASKLSITRLNMSLSSSADDAQQGTTLDVSSYISPMDDDDDNNNETKDYVMQQTMIRVKNPIQSLDFYCKILGFRLIHFSEVRSFYGL